MFGLPKKIFHIETSEDKLYMTLTVFGKSWHMENFALKLRDFIKRPFLDKRYRNFVESSRVIVSLTSFPARIDEAHLAIYTLLDQTRKADVVVLWLASEEFPEGEKSLPPKLLALKKRGLEIRWCENIGSFKKLIPALREFPDDVLITADDDLLYGKDWLQGLLNGYAAHPKDINCSRMRRIKFDGNGRIMPYTEWGGLQNYADNPDASCLNWPTTGGGVLYPPGSFDPHALDHGLALKLCPTADDVWFWAMCAINGKKFRLVKKHAKEFPFVSASKQLHAPRLGAINIGGKRNNVQIEAVLAHFPKLAGIIEEARLLERKSATPRAEKPSHLLDFSLRASPAPASDGS
jgi:hypothetical protein